MSRPPVRSLIHDFESYSPGLTIDEIRQRYHLDRVVKLASNENPLGTSPVVVETIQRHASLSFRYPQAGSPALTAALALHLGIPQECIVAGNGSDEIIDLLLRVKTEPGRDNIVVCAPSFSIYTLQARLCGVEVRTVPLEPDFNLPLEAMLARTDERTGLVFVTSPDNPSGVATPGARLAEMARKLPQGCLLVVDEAYVEFTDPLERYDTLRWWQPDASVVALRTFSKIHGLAGLRLGYGIMPSWLADSLLRVKLPFSVNLLAEKAGIAALEDMDFLRATLETVRLGRDFLAREMAGLGCEVTPSMSNFLLFRPPMDGKRVFEALLSEGVIIRPLASYRMPDRLRVSVGTAEENALFVTALRKILSIQS